MMARKSVTIKDIAEKAGASQTAVSFVLNNRCQEMRISDQLRKRVLGIAQDLGYRPSLVARSLSSKRTSQLGVVIPYIAEGYGPSLAAGIETEARSHGYQIILAQHRNDMQLLIDAVEKSLDRNLDGLIVVSMAGFSKKKAYKELMDSGKPVVFVERDPGEDDVRLVSVDNTRAITLGVKYLADLGHKRVALCQNIPNEPETRRRRLAFQSALDELGLAPDEQTLLSVTDELRPDNRDTVAAWVRKTMDSPDPPTAILGISAQRSIWVYESLIELGCRVPEDVSLIAITGQNFGSFHIARITSVRFSYEEMGLVAGRIMVDSIRHPIAPPQRIYVSAKLIEGETVSPPLAVD